MVVVYGFLVYEPDVFGAAVVTGEVLYIVFLDFAGFFFDAVLGAGDFGFVEAVPFLVGEVVAVEFFQLLPEVGYQLIGAVDVDAFIALFLEHGYEAVFQVGFALVAGGSDGVVGAVFGDYGAFGGKHDGIVGWHEYHL